MKRYIFTVVLTLLLFIATTVSLFMRVSVFAQTSTPTSTPTPGANIGQPITFDAPLIFSGEQTISAYKFVDSTDDNYYLDPSSSGNSLILSGKVGIGTTSPTRTLDVVGNISFSNNHQIYTYKANGTQIALLGLDGSDNNWWGPSVAGWNTYFRNGPIYMTALTNGNVGIGTTAPNQNLELYVSDSSTTFGASYHMLINNANTANRYTSIGLGPYSGGFPQALIGFQQRNNDGLDFSGDLVFGTARAGQYDEAPIERMRIDSSGQVGLGNAPFANTRLALFGIGQTSGSYGIQATNNVGTPIFWTKDNGAGYLLAAAWTYGSDRRFKENIVSINGSGLDTISKLNPVKFDYINGQKGQLGFIAQDVQQVIPEAVDVVDEQTGYLGLKTDFIVPYLVKGMQELNAKFDKLTLEAKKLIIDGVDVMKKLTELSDTVESQQKQIDTLTKELRELKK